MAEDLLHAPGHPPALIGAALARAGLSGEGIRLGVAVSGGADSVCLLDCLGGLALENRWTLVVLHLNHGLRGAESDEDEKFVQNIAHWYGAEYRSEKRVVEAGPDLENRARRARLDFFAREIRSQSLAAVATGHTQDDQAETVLLRLLRGAAPESLRGIIPLTSGGLVRPMLGVTHDDACAWLTLRGIGWREDSSNRTTGFTRNWLRNEVLPAIESRFPAARRTLARHAALALDDGTFWQDTAEQAVMKIFRRRPDCYTCPAEALRSLPPALGRRAVRFALNACTGASLETVQMEAVMELAGGQRRSGKVRLADAEVWLSMGQLRFGRPSRAPEVTPQIIDKAGTYALPWRQGQLAVENFYAQPATLRAWRPGDRAAWTQQPRRLKELFQEARIPAWERAAWPVLESGGLILWAGKLGSVEGIAARELPENPEPADSVTI